MPATLHPLYPTALQDVECSLACGQPIALGDRHDWDGPLSLLVGLNLSRDPDRLSRPVLCALQEHAPPGALTAFTLGDVSAWEDELFHELFTAHGPGVRRLTIDNPSNIEDPPGLLVDLVKECPNITDITVLGIPPCAQPSASTCAYQVWQILQQL